MIEQAIDAALAVVASDELADGARVGRVSRGGAVRGARRRTAALPTVVNGAIDLVYRDGDDWPRVDYKTDADAKDVDLRARHQTQLEAYERAWKRVSGAKIAARILSARHGMSDPL